MIRALLAGLLLGLAGVAASAADIDALWDYDRPAESEARFRGRLAEAQQRGDAAEAGELITQIARAQGLQGRIEAGGRTLDLLQAELPALPPEVSVRYLLERGRLLNSAGEPKKAWRWFRNALAQAQRHELDFLAIDAMHMLAISEGGRGSIDWNLKALAAVARSQDPRTGDWLGSLYNNLGWAYYDLKDYPKALDYLRQAQTWHEGHGAGRPLLIARWSVAKALRAIGENDRALTVLVDLLRAWKQLGEEDGYVDEEIAENLLAQGRSQEARGYFARALELLSRDEWLVKNEPARLNRMRQLAQ